MIEQLVAEATECDFKVALEIKKPKSWLKSVSAFANGIGGTLFFGINDDRAAIGLQEIQKDAEIISRLIKERITPLPQFVLTPFREKEKDILALKVVAGATTPYYYKADGVMEAYVRVGNESVTAPDYIVNALIHRDYIVLGGEIHIDMYDDRVEIVSPGGMFEGEPVQECDINTMRSVRRNPVIADLFHRMKYMERRGSGLRKIVSETEKLPGYREELKPEFFSTSCDFKVVLKNINYHQDNHQDNHQDRNVTSQKVTEFCTEPKSIKEIIEFFGYKDRRSFNLRYIKPLLDEGKLKMTIPEKPRSRNQKYITVK